MKCPSETLQNLPYFWNKITHIVFFSFFNLCYFIFFPNECPGLYQQQHRPGYSLGGNNKVALIEKNYMGFYFPKLWQILKRFARSFHQ